MSHEALAETGDTIKIGTDNYKFTQETQQLLIKSYVSKYQKDTSVIIINESHDSSEGHYSLFKGLESFFASNPSLVKQTMFLSEGTTSNQPISIQALIDEEPHPTDDTIRQVLQSHMITGYMAYEWKHQDGIPIIGIEDEGLYALCRRFASLCRENPNAIFQHRKYEDGTEYDIPLLRAWAFLIAARNKRMAQTLVEHVRRYSNPMLFAAWDHIKDRRPPFEKKWDKHINRNLVSAQHMGLMGALMFPWSMTGEDWFLFRNVPKDSETFDIDHYLKLARIGYTFLNPKGAENATPQDEENYKRIFRAQREK